MNATKNAQRLLNIISLEVQLQQRRVDGGFIPSVKAPGIVLERLTIKAKNDVDLKTFLTTMAYIPKEEDEDPNVEWAEDKRDQRQQDVRNTTPEGELGDSREFPTPGERVC